MKRANILISGIVLMIFLSACTSGADSDSETDNSVDSSEAAELKVALMADAPTLDPHITTTNVTRDISQHFFETLVAFDANGEVQPLLAESFEQSDDGLTITFHLREDVLFHDGSVLEADDVVASMNRWMELSNVSDALEGVSVEAEDSSTVVLAMEENLSVILPMLAERNNAPVIMPEHVIEEADADGVNEYIGTGPFYFEEWVQGQYVELRKFEDYVPHGEEPDGLAGKREALVDTLLFEIVSDASTRLTGIQTGIYDVVENIPYDSADQVENDSNLRVDTTPMGQQNAFFNKKEGVFEDQTAREAVVKALDMEAIATAAFASDNYYRLSPHIMMEHQEGQWYSEVGLEIYNQPNPEEAQQLLTDIDYDGEEIVILTSRDNDASYQASVVIQQQLEQIGMNVSIEVTDWPTFQEMRTDESNWDIFIVGSAVVSEPATNRFMSEDFPGWTESEEMEDLLDEFRGQATVEDAIPLYEDIMEWYWDYLPVAKITDFYIINASRNELEGVDLSTYFIFWNVSKEK